MFAPTRGTPMDAQKHSLLAQAILYKTLSTGFAYPDAEMMVAWRDGSFAETVTTALASLAMDDAPTNALTRADADALNLDEEYTFLFLRGGGVAPYEASFLNRNLASNNELADVTGFYRAFGFEIAASAKELPDHIAIEFEFLAVLCAKEAYAIENAWREQAEICEQARADFIAQHLGLWLNQFVERVRGKARLGFYPALAHIAARATQVSAHVVPA